MKLLSTFVFLSSATAAADSNIYYNTDGYATQLALQIGGSATGSTVNVKGRVDTSGEWVTLSGIDMNALSVAKNIQANGVYNFDISGLSQVKVSLTAITSGSLSAFGRISA